MIIHKKENLTNILVLYFECYKYSNTAAADINICCTDFFKYNPRLREKHKLTIMSSIVLKCGRTLGLPGRWPFFSSFLRSCLCLDLTVWGSLSCRDVDPRSLLFSARFEGFASTFLHLFDFVISKYYINKSVISLDCNTQLQLNIRSNHRSEDISARILQYFV